MLSLLKKTVLTAAAGLALFASSAMAEVRLQGSGATFPAPLYGKWAAMYQEKHPDVKIDYQAIGSGGGIKAITDKTVYFAGSDAPLNPKEIEALGGKDKVVQVPATAGGVVAAYNLPGVTQPIKLTGELLADIYLGKVAKWNDSKIAELNAGVALPDLAITPVYRTDGSGTTFVFTSYLATQSADFKAAVGAGKQVKWPVGQGGKGSQGVSAVVSQTPGAVGYVESNYASQNKIAAALLRNKAGKFVAASPESVAAAGAAAAAKLEGHHQSVDIWNQDGEGAYPISAFTYLIFYTDLNNLKSKEEAQALVGFVTWAMTDGQKISSGLDYAPLTEEVQAKVLAGLKGVTYKGEALPAK
jgi:phosphate transport system substrate-binding protein